jgi:hypothetical protein
MCAIVSYFKACIVCTSQIFLCFIGQCLLKFIRCLISEPLLVIAGERFFFAFFPVIEDPGIAPGLFPEQVFDPALRRKAGDCSKQYFPDLSVVVLLRRCFQAGQEAG